MQIRKIQSAQNNFASWCVIGRDSDNYKKALEPYKKKLDEITEGFDVTITETPKSVVVFDKYAQEYVSLHGLPIVTIKPYNNAQRIIPVTKLCVYPGAGEMQCKTAMAEEMIDVIKKGISIYG